MCRLLRDHRPEWPTVALSERLHRLLPMSLCGNHRCSRSSRNLFHISLRHNSMGSSNSSSSSNSTTTTITSMAPMSLHGRRRDQENSTLWQWDQVSPHTMQPQAATFHRHNQGQPRQCTLCRELDTRTNRRKCKHSNLCVRSCSPHSMAKHDHKPQDSRSRSRSRGRLQRQGPRLLDLECQSGQPLVAWPGHTRLLHPVRHLLVLLHGVGRAWGPINCPAAADGWTGFRLACMVPARWGAHAGSMQAMACNLNPGCLHGAVRWRRHCVCWTC